MTEPAAPGFAAAPFGTPARRKLAIRQVWGDNLQSEFALISTAAKLFRYVSMDTEFPGVIHRHPWKDYHAQTPTERYDLIKSNVDALHLIQVGLAFAASLGAPPCLIFEINLCEFDPSEHPHDSDSIALLRGHGIDFAAHRSRGVDARKLAALLMSSGLVRVGNNITWLTFGSGYDFGYLLKLLTDCKLPNTLPEFLALVRDYFGEAVYDVKFVVDRRCPDLRGSLNMVAASLGAERDVGEAHQAGSDCALVIETFRRFRCLHLPRDSAQQFAGVISGLDVAPAPNGNLMAE